MSSTDFDWRTSTSNRARDELSFIRRSCSSSIGNKVVSLDIDVAESLSLRNSTSELPINLIFRRWNISPTTRSLFEITLKSTTCKYLVYKVNLHNLGFPVEYPVDTQKSGIQRKVCRHFGIMGFVFLDCEISETNAKTTCNGFILKKLGLTRALDTMNDCKTDYQEIVLTSWANKCHLFCYCSIFYFWNFSRFLISNFLRD